MHPVTIRFDEVSIIGQGGGWSGRAYWPRQTTFSFMSAGKYFAYAAAPGWPTLHDGLTVTALLEDDDWKSPLGWINHETGEIAGPSPREIQKQAGFTAVWFFFGILVVALGIQKESAVVLLGVFFSGSCLYWLHSEFREWRKARITLETLERLADEMRHNKSFDTDAHVRPLPAVAPDLCAGQVQR